MSAQAKVHGLGIGRSNEWYTPASVFDALGCQFDTDVAAPWDVEKLHVPTDHWICRDSLSFPWKGLGFVWMNPPFGGRGAVEPWMDRFFDHGNGIALTPDRTSAPWFWSAWAKADLILFTRKIKFIRPDGTDAGCPANGTALWASGLRGTNALHRAASVGFGVLARPANFVAQPIPGDGSAAAVAPTGSSRAPLGQTDENRPDQLADGFSLSHSKVCK